VRGSIRLGQKELISISQPQDILIVDDEQVMRDLYCRILKNECRVIVVEDGFAAIELAKKHRFDIIFMDIRMPGKNGVETLREIKKTNPEAITFMMTGCEVPELIEEALLEGASGCLYKPFGVKDVINAIKTQRVALDGLPVQNKNNKLLLDVNSIFYINSEGNKTYVHTVDHQFSSRITLAHLEKLLGCGIFMRVHEQYIVNLSKVKDVVLLPNADFLLVLMDKKRSEIPVDCDKTKAVEQLLRV